MQKQNAISMCGSRKQALPFFIYLRPPKKSRCGNHKSGWATSVMRWIAALPLREVTCTSLGGKRAIWQKKGTLLGKSTPFSAPNG